MFAITREELVDGIHDELYEHKDTRAIYYVLNNIIPNECVAYAVLAQMDLMDEMIYYTYLFAVFPPVRIVRAHERVIQTETATYTLLLCVYTNPCVYVLYIGTYSMLLIVYLLGIRTIILYYIIETHSREHYDGASIRRGTSGIRYHHVY